MMEWMHGQWAVTSGGAVVAMMAAGGVEAFWGRCHQEILAANPPAIHHECDRTKRFGRRQSVADLQVMNMARWAAVHRKGQP
jgi:hypothetical protein